MACAALVALYHVVTMRRRSAGERGYSARGRTAAGNGSLGSPGARRRAIAVGRVMAHVC